MARKSAAALTTVTPLSGRRPTPPADLPKYGATLWKQICNSLPAGYFTPGDLPLLTAYCMAHDHKAFADLLVSRDGLLIDGKPNPGILLSMQLSASMASLAGKLRLCQSSRTRPEAAALKKALTNARRPWEFGKEDPGEEFFREMDSRCAK